MLLANRINSILSQQHISISEAITKFAEDGVFTHIDLNYPEHLHNEDISSILKTLERTNIKVNGVAVRFRDDFIGGEFSNVNTSVTQNAIALCKESIDVCQKLGGDIVTIWLGYDGFDYPFQIPYTKIWNRLVATFREIADYNSNIKISIEYKPYQPRAFAILPDIGTTLLMINDIDRPNMGITLDYCHMLMKRENPAFSLNLAKEKTNLCGIHLNDGYGINDDGLMLGSISLMQTLEFLYYLKKIKYNGVIYFDTFPVREESCAEGNKNAQVIQRLDTLIDVVGMDKIESVVNAHDALLVQDLLLSFLREV